MKSQEIAKGIWKISGNSNAYIIKKREIAIDAGDYSERRDFEEEVRKIIPPESIRQVFFTHLHYDHVGNYALFSNAKLCASEEEIKFFEKDRLGALINIELSGKFSGKIFSAEKELEGSKFLKIIETPGHTGGSACYYMQKEKILFSGDTIFLRGYGRTDLPGGSIEKLRGSVRKIKGLEYRILFPGHDY
ncbi:MAG: MBL fold metallo-hydrolase [Candidatus Woesearchaeota archaeon]|nr:MBL fold metallo-hydrolase [Candidatus Woesearchaeota archaeon]